MSSKHVIHLPILISGRPIYPSDERKSHVIHYDSGTEVHLPEATDDDIRHIRESNKFLLHGLHLQNIITFLQKVGRFWSVENSRHPLYQRALDDLSRVTGYDRKMAQRELNLIHVLTIHGATLHDLLDAELGNRFYLDEWVPRWDAYVHAQPFGNALHVMVGNVPVSSIMSMVRSIITKNQTIAKLPKRDPITALYFARSMAEVDPDHPVTRSMNILYWPGGDKAEEKFISLADAICVWGGGQAVARVKQLARPGVNVIEFGPKTSFAVVGRESANSKKVAVDLAHDIAIYNQEACFSPQMVFVEGDHVAFKQHLADGLKLYSGLLSKGTAAADVHAQVSRARLEALYGGNELVASEGSTDWTLAMVQDPSEINEHPLSRTIYLIPVNHIRDCLPYISPATQTITLSPWSRNPEIREEVTLHGAAKITEIGLAEWQRVGMPHDNVFPLHNLVRWVGVERGLDHWGKYIEDGPVDTTKWLMMQQRMLEQVKV